MTRPCGLHGVVIEFDATRTRIDILRVTKAPSEMPFPFNLYARVVDPPQGRQLFTLILYLALARGIVPERCLRDGRDSAR